MRTRQTRHFGDKPLIPQGRSMSGSPKNPTWNPTNPSQKPDKLPPAGLRRHTLLTILTLLRIPRATSLWLHKPLDFWRWNPWFLGQEQSARDGRATSSPTRGPMARVGSLPRVGRDTAKWTRDSQESRYPGIHLHGIWLGSNFNRSPLREQTPRAAGSASRS